LELSKPTVTLATRQLTQEERELIRHLAGLKEVKEQSDHQGLRLSVGRLDAWLAVDDETVRRYSDVLQGRRNEIRNYLQRLEKQLSNQGYLKSAPPELVQQTRDRKAENELLLSKLDDQLATIGH
jgi:valyl-tRNA synthetase